MSGIDRKIILDRRHLAKHLPNTPQRELLLQRLGAGEDTPLQVAKLSSWQVLTGTHTVFFRGYDRYGSMFTEAIGVRIDPNGSKIPLFYGEVKIDADNKYHPIPRTRPSEE
ncbi:MAG: hypothetical protein F6K42_27345 [Leptolyngbya sp. SIO1D8]|nr:hypothetical protein [Leptolyngbya sp. SIO1D8]